MCIYTDMHIFIYSVVISDSGAFTGAVLQNWAYVF